MKRIYEQRIGLAVAAAKAGARVTFHIEGDYPAYLTWHAGSKRHVISSGPMRGMKAMLPLVRAEFERRASEGRDGFVETAEQERRVGVELAS